MHQNVVASGMLPYPCLGSAH